MDICDTLTNANARKVTHRFAFRIEFARWRLVDQVSPIIPVGLFGQAQIGFCQILKLDSQLRSSVALRLCVQFGGFYSVLVPCCHWRTPLTDHRPMADV